MSVHVPPSFSGLAVRRFEKPAPGAARLPHGGPALSAPPLAQDSVAADRGFGALCDDADHVMWRLSQALEAMRREAGDAFNADALRLALVAHGLIPGGEPAATPPEPERPAPATKPARKKSGLVKWRLKRVLAFIDAHLAEAVSLADMACAAGLSRMHFAAQFRAATGLRPHEYLLKARIERAQSLMRETRDPLAQVALSVGFQTQAHFTTVFRRFAGATPRQWRCAAGA